ncbi:hypothetical protein J3459_012407 [Metarhizium acridum]|nr:hypothetical protein J3459_012407 [Metarhizium acridum]
MGWIEDVNVKVATSVVGKWFRLDGSGHPRERKGSYFLTELRAGMTTFFAMAYIIAVNASIVSDSGGTCVCPHTAADPTCDKDADYMLCTQDIKRDIVTATAAISALSCFCMGLFANLPVALAPGMGLNAYFAYTVVGYHGTGLVPYRVALTAIFVEGFIFLGLAILGLRQWLARAIPHSIKVATGVGIGLYLTLIGLTYSEGIGVVVGATATPVELAGCSPENRLADGTCPSWDKMRHPAMWIGIFCGGILTVILTMFRVKGAIIIGILLVSIVSWPRTTPVTYFPYTDVGNNSFDFFKKVVTFHPIQHTLNVQDWNVSEYGGQFGLALITFLYVDILDATGTLYSMARFAGLMDPVTQDFEGSAVAYMVDALCISVGAVLGVPPVTAFVESGAGISEGGKTGLTSMATGLCFFIAVFFRSHLRLDSPLGHGLCSYPRRINDGRCRSRNQLEIHGRCRPRLPRHLPHAFHVLDCQWLDRQHLLVHHHQRHGVAGQKAVRRTHITVQHGRAGELDVAHPRRLSSPVVGSSGKGPEGLLAGGSAAHRGCRSAQAQLRRAGLGCRARG